MGALKDDPVRPYLIQAYLVCPRQAWLEGHGILGDQEQEDLALGRWTHETSYRRLRREVWVDEHLKIDLIEGEIVAEIKKSSSRVEAAKWQLLYYLYYLKNEKGIHREGLLLFPRERRTEKITLTPAAELELEKKIQKLRELLLHPTPPEAQWSGVCKRCSLAEYCWGEMEAADDS